MNKKQLEAVAMIAAGTTLTEIAKKSDVSRSTLHRWLKLPEFLAALNETRRQLRDEQLSRLDALGSAALSTLESAVSGGDAKLALAVVQGLGFLSGSRSRIGPDDPVLVKEMQETERMWQELQVGT